MPARHDRDRPRAALSVEESPGSAAVLCSPAAGPPPCSPRCRPPPRVAAAAIAAGMGTGRVTTAPAVVVDLTHTFRAGFPVYTGDEPKRRTIKNFDPRRLLLPGVEPFGEHSGTHLDAPGAFRAQPAAGHMPCGPTSCSLPRS